MSCWLLIHLNQHICVIIDVISSLHHFTIKYEKLHFQHLTNDKCMCGVIVEK